MANTHRVILPPMEGRRLSRPKWLATYRDGLPACRWSTNLH